MFKKVLSVTSLLSLGLLVFAPLASAHVTVKPTEVSTAEFQTFTISAPNEKEISTTNVKLTIPDGLKYVTPTQKTGWQIDVEKQGSGESAVVKSITWSGSEVKAGFRDEFTFSGQVPDKATELQWKAYQTYADGSVVSWDKASHGDDHDEDKSSGPFSVTKVVTDTPADVSVQNATQAANDAKTTASTAAYIAVAGVAVGLTGVYFATRKRS